MIGRDLLGEELSVGGVGAALAAAEAAAVAAGGRDPMGNPSFHCSNISSAFLPDPFLPGGDKDPVRATRQAAWQGQEEGKAMQMVGAREQRPKMHKGRMVWGKDGKGVKG